MIQLLEFWYGWGVFLGVFLAAAIAIYIFFDARNYSPSKTLVPRVLGALGAVLTLPSLYARLTTNGEIMVALLELLDLVEDASGLEDFLGDMFSTFTSLRNFMYLGLAGLALALVALVYYMMRGRQEEYSQSITYIPTAPPPPPPPTPEPIAPQQRPVAPTMPLNQEPPPQAWLVVRNGPRTGTQFGLGMSRPNVIGRDPNKADIIIDEDSVSREHARVRHENGQFVIYDMASTGGTYVNGNVVQRQMLYDNDRINLGRVELVYKKVA